MKLTANDIARFSHGKLVAGSASAVVDGVSIDTRTLEPNELFVAIRGPLHDGHDYLERALERGACGVVVSRPIELSEISRSAFQVHVRDTSRALQDLAQGVREQAELRVAAVTGSMGKTTTKEAAAAAIASRFRVLKTEGNLNNLFGLPLSILKHRDEDVAVLEMGMSEPGEIARLTEIAKPDVGVLTNVAEVHLEFFASVSEIADAKGELLLGLSGDAVAVVNADDPLVLEQARQFAGRQIRFGLAASSDVRARAIRSTPSGLRFEAEEGGRSVEVASSLHGRHNVYNLLAGLAAARALDVPLEDAASGLSSLTPAHRRGERIDLPGEVLLIDETYNSNPRALVCALDALAEEECTRRVAIVGDMLELGANASELHREVGRHAASLGLSLLVGVGPLGSDIVAGAREAGMGDDALATLADARDAAAFVEHRLSAGDRVLVKGSRGVGLDETVELLKRALSGGTS